MASITGNVDAVAKQLNDVLENLLQQSNKLLTQYQNQLFKDEFDADRFFIAENIGAATNPGFIDLTREFNQPVVIEGIIINFDANATSTLTIDRFSRIISNTQSRENIIAPVRYVAGPGKTVKLSWSVLPAQMPYFAVYGKYIGSKFG